MTTLDKQFYVGGYDIDFDKAIKRRCFDPNVYDVRSIFEINNKRYICKEMEFTLNAYGRKGAWTGTFYPIRIVDVPGVRWILENGRWRDFGVWLDDGHWIDV